jgi:hypothetical protein
MAKRIKTYDSGDETMILSSVQDTEFCNPLEYFFESHLMLMLNVKREAKALGLLEILKQGQLSLKEVIEIGQKIRWHWKLGKKKCLTRRLKNGNKSLKKKEK